MKYSTEKYIPRRQVGCMTACCTESTIKSAWLLVLCGFAVNKAQ